MVRPDVLAGPKSILGPILYIVKVFFYLCWDWILSSLELVENKVLDFQGPRVHDVGKHPHNFEGFHFTVEGNMKQEEIDKIISEYPSLDTILPKKEDLRYKVAEILLKHITFARAQGRYRIMRSLLYWDGEEYRSAWDTVSCLHIEFLAKWGFRKLWRSSDRNWILAYIYTGAPNVPEVWGVK